METTPRAGASETRSARPFQAGIAGAYVVGWGTQRFVLAPHGDVSARWASHPGLPAPLHEVPWGGMRHGLYPYVPGITLSALLAELERAGTHVEVAAAVWTGHIVTGAVAAAHAVGDRHRGLGPEHVWLGADGTVSVWGFGQTTALAMPHRGRHAPHEQCSVPHPSRDVYALGAMLADVHLGLPASGDAGPSLHPTSARMPAAVADGLVAARQPLPMRNWVRAADLAATYARCVTESGRAALAQHVAAAMAASERAA